MIRGVLFDMDGLMIDSEPLWQRAEIEIFATVGLALTRNDCLETRGRRIDEVVDHWWRVHRWETPSKDAIRDAVVDRVIELVGREGAPKPGLQHAIEFFASRALPIGIASSSGYRIIDAVLDRLRLRSHFAIVHSGEEEARGKPDPAVYRTAARKLGLPAAACVALEDSPSGVASAKAAGMRCIAVIDAAGRPSSEVDAERSRLGLADVVLESLGEIDAQTLQLLQH